jgi:PhnB protein
MGGYTVSEAKILTSIAPWLAVSDGARAVEYYKAALGAIDAYHLDGDDGTVMVAQLQVDGAAFWVHEDPENSPEARRQSSVRMILTVDDPDSWFERAIAAGATELAAVHEEHGWRTGRVSDPFGHDWEFSKPTAPIW